MTFILGTGNIGALVASSLRQVSKKDVFLLFKNEKKLLDFINNNDSTVLIKYSNLGHTESHKFSATTPRELLEISEKSLTQLAVLNNKKSLTDSERYNISLFYKIYTDLHSKSRFNFLNKVSELQLDEGNDANLKSKKNNTGGQYIDNLIVTTKAQDTMSSIIPLLPLINNKTNLVFIQNGMGAIEDLKDKYFDKLPAENQPNSIYQGIISHGVYKVEPTRFDFVHTSGNKGELKLGRFLHFKDWNKSNLSDTETPDIIHDLLSTDLNARLHENPLEFELIKLDKLIVNSIINPLTTLLNCKNGQLLEIPTTRPMLHKLLNENIHILRKWFDNINGASLSYIDKHLIDTYLDERRLMDLILNIANSTRDNYSSMLQDYKFGRSSSEIQYLNGYFLKLGNGHYNRIIIDLLESKRYLNMLAKEQ